MHTSLFTRDDRAVIHFPPFGIVLVPMHGRGYWEGDTEPGLTSNLCVRMHRHPDADEVAFEVIADAPVGRLSIRGEFHAEREDAWADCRDSIHAWSERMYREVVVLEGRAACARRARVNETTAA